jgi:hypothetical protein
MATHTLKKVSIVPKKNPVKPSPGVCAGNQKNKV